MGRQSKGTVAAAVGTLALICAGPSLAAPDAAVEGYSSDGGTVLGQIEEGNTGDQTIRAPETQPLGAPDRGDSPAARLPFTGLDIGLLAANGFLLLSLGLVVRRLSRPAAAPWLIGRSER